MMTKDQVLTFLGAYVEKWTDENLYEQATNQLLMELEHKLNELLKVADAGYSAIVDFNLEEAGIEIRLHETARPAFIEIGIVIGEV